MERLTLPKIQDKFKKQIDEGKINFLFELEITSDEIQFIREYGKVLLNQAEKNCHTYDICVAYYLMDVGRRFYDDGNYWSKVHVATSKQNVIGNFFLETIGRYGLVNKQFQRKFVDAILMHSFIPERYCDRFFDFVNRYYTIVLGQQMSDDLNDKLKKFADVFCSDNFAQLYPEFKSFNPIVSTRSVLTNAEYFGPLVTKIIKRLANDYDSIEDVNLGVYDAPFKNWLNAPESNKLRKLALNESPYIQFDVVKSEFNLVIPSRKVESNDKSVMVMRSNMQLIDSSSLCITNQFDVYVSDPVVFKLTCDPLDNFTAIIGASTVYSNSNPGFILLNKHGKRQTKPSFGTNMLILPKDEEINLHYEVITTKGNIKVITFIIVEGQKLEVMGKSFVVEKEVSDCINVVTPSLGIDCRDQDDNKYDIYETLPRLKISYVKDSNFQLTVIHKSDRVYFSDYNSLIKNRACFRNGTDIIFDLNLSSLKNEDGIYTIRLRNKEVYKFAVLNNMNYTFIQQEYAVNGKSSLKCSYFEDDITFDTTQGVVTLPPLPMDGRKLRITVEIPSRRYSFDKKYWILFNSEEIYYRNLSGDKIYIYCHDLVMPVIKPDLQGANVLNLDIEGKYLVADISRIKQIGDILEYSDIYLPKLLFYCDNFKLFTIRYYGEYRREGQHMIFRINAPNETYGKIIIPNTDPIIFQESISIPAKYGCKISVEECYDNGFSGELSIKVICINREFDIKYKSEIIQGTQINEFKYVCDEITHHYLSNPFYYLYGLEESLPDQDEIDAQRKLFRDLDEIAYSYIIDKIKEILLEDKNPDRVSIRIKRLWNIDNQYANELASNFIKKYEGVKVKDTLKYLTNKKGV